MADIFTSTTHLAPALRSKGWASRLRAGGLHFAVSAAITMAVAALVFGLWYPAPYREISGGRTLFLLLMCVDVILGPLVTFLVFNPRKSRRELTMDLTMVALLQLGALAYGVWTVYVARPVHLVFEYQRLAVVHAVDIPDSTLSLAPPPLQQLPHTGPTLLSLRALRPEEAVESMTLAMDGIAQAAQPALWQEYDQARDNILEISQPLQRLYARFPAERTRIDQAVKSSDSAVDRLRTLPLLSRQQAWTALIDGNTGRPVGFIHLDSF